MFYIILGEKSNVKLNKHKFGILIISKIDFYDFLTVFCIILGEISNVEKNKHRFGILRI